VSDPVAARDLIRDDWRLFLDRLERRGPEVWPRRTRLGDWTVSDLVAHACWGTSMEADALRRARTGPRERAEGRTPGAGAGRHRLLADLHRARNQLVAELSTLAARDHGHDLPLPYGDMALRLGLSIFVMEAGVHGSDLAHALGEDDTLSPAVCAATAEVLAAFAPVFAEGAGSTLPPGAVIVLRADSGELRVGQRPDGTWTSAADGPATTEITGPDSDLWLFALGRRPLDVLTVTGDADLAGTFKHLVPGP
jgi:uncharacterized protein (TIGR03083 family)